MAALAALLLGGRYLLNPLFRVLALTRAREVMTAAALLVVLGAAALMELAGLSMAMGAFLAGLMLADSAFRHELEADIEPFRGILLGLFFIAVGMAINVDNFLYSWRRIALAVPVVMLVKAHRPLRARPPLPGRATTMPSGSRCCCRRPASSPSCSSPRPRRCGRSGRRRRRFVAGVVTVTMALTPFSVMLGRYLLKDEPSERLEEDFEGAGGNVLVVGFGRFGQILAQVLLAQNVNATILDASAERVRQAARFGFRIYFGDGTRRDVLRAAGAEQASIICICVDKPEVANRIVDLVVARFPSAKVLRALLGPRRTRWSCSPRASTTSCARPTNRRCAFGAETLRGLGFEADEVDDGRRRCPPPRRRPARAAAERRHYGRRGRDEADAKSRPEPLTRRRRGRRAGRSAHRAERAPRSDSAAVGLGRRAARWL